MLSFARQSGESVFSFGRRDAQFFGLLFDLLRAFGKLIQHPLRDTSQFPPFGRSLDAITQFRQLFGKPRMERRFKIRRITFQIPELPGLPFLFGLIPSRVEGVAMRVQMRIRYAVHWPRGEVDELRPNHVARLTIFIRPVFPHPCFNLRFNFSHGLIHRHFERT